MTVFFEPPPGGFFFAALLPLYGRNAVHTTRNTRVPPYLLPLVGDIKQSYSLHELASDSLNGELT